MAAPASITTYGKRTVVGSGHGPVAPLGVTRNENSLPITWPTRAWAMPRAIHGQRTYRNPRARASAYGTPPPPCPTTSRRSGWRGGTPAYSSRETATAVSCPGHVPDSPVVAAQAALPDKAERHPEVSVIAPIGTPRV